MGLQDFISMIGEPQEWHQKEGYSKSKEFTYGLNFEYTPISTTGDVWSAILVKMTNNIIPLYPSTDPSVDPDPCKKYEPSETLVSLMIKNAIKLDKQISDKLEEFGDSLNEYDDEPEVESDNLNAQISDRIEGLFSILARYDAGEKEHILISENDKLTIHFREEVQEWLDLDNYNLKEVWDLLYKELSIFASSPRDRVWGKIMKDANDNIKLLIEPKKEFEIINPSDNYILD